MGATKSMMQEELIKKKLEAKFCLCDWVNRSVKFENILFLKDLNIIKIKY